MRYQLRRKLLSWGRDFTIEDESGRQAFLVDGEAFSIGARLRILDSDGEEVAYIRQKMLSWGPTYEVTCRGEPVATVKKQLFTLFKCRFEVDVPGPDDLEAEGDFLDHEYVFSRRGRTVARVSRQWFRLTDTYGVDVAEGEDDVLILASAVVIDLACHDDHDHD